MNQRVSGEPTYDGASQEKIIEEVTENLNEHANNQDRDDTPIKSTKKDLEQDD